MFSSLFNSHSKTLSTYHTIFTHIRNNNLSKANYLIKQLDSLDELKQLNTYLLSLKEKAKYSKLVQTTQAKIDSLNKLDLGKKFIKLYQNKFYSY